MKADWLALCKDLMALVVYGQDFCNNSVKLIRRSRSSEFMSLHTDIRIYHLLCIIKRRRPPINTQRQPIAGRGCQSRWDIANGRMWWIGRFRRWFVVHTVHKIIDKTVPILIYHHLRGFVALSAVSSGKSGLWIIFSFRCQFYKYLFSWSLFFFVQIGNANSKHFY